MADVDDRGSAGDEEGGKDLWSWILSDGSRSRKLPSNKSIVLLGCDGSGKTTLISKLRGREDEISKGHGLEYTYLDVHDEERDDSTRLGVWILDGNPLHKNLLQFALTPKCIKNTLVVQVVDMSRPWTIMESLRSWTEVLREHIHSLKLQPKERNEMEERIVRHFQEYVEPDGTGEDRRRSWINDKDKVLLSLDENVLSDNLGLPMVVVLTKTDCMLALEKDRDYMEEHFDFIQQHVRRHCLKYGASLLYTSVKKNKNCSLLYKYLVHRIYGLPFNSPALVVDKESVFIPAGWDSVKKINILSEHLKVILPEDAFDDHIVKPQLRKPIQDIIIAKDEQTFLAKQQQLLQMMPATVSSGIARQQQQLLQMMPTTVSSGIARQQQFDIMSETAMKVTEDTVTISELKDRWDDKGQSVQLKHSDPNELELYINKMPASTKEESNRERTVIPWKKPQNHRQRLAVLDEMKKPIQNLERPLMEMQERFKEKDEQLRRTEEQLRSKIEELKKNDEELRKKENQVREKDERLRKTKMQLRLKEVQLENTEEELRLTGEQVKVNEERLRKKDKQVRKKDEQLKVAEERLREKYDQLKINDEEVREKDKQLRAKTEQSQNLQRQLSTLQGDKKKESAKFQEQLSVKAQELNDLQKELRDREQDNVVLERKLSAAEVKLSEYESQLESRDWVLCRDEVQFSRDNCLGAGSFGQVFKGRYRGCVVAIKRLHLSTLTQQQRRAFGREMDIASRCRHPCLLQFIGATQDESPLFVTELMETSLQNLLKKRKQEKKHLTETEIVFISLDVATALNYLHRRKPPIVHRDVSSANVLLWKQNNQWRGKLGDYGTAKFLQETMTANPGTPIYEAPEICSSLGQTVAIDVFSFGILFCEMCTGEPPESKYREDTVRQLTNKKFGELILWCIEEDAQMRPSMEEIIEKLEDLNVMS